jgi:hypothetical protein
MKSTEGKPMSIFSASSKGNGNGSQSDRTSANMKSAAKAAKRGGTAIRQPVKARPAQHGKP